MNRAYRSGVIELEQITAAAQPYRITTATDYDSLATSIGAAGLINPPIVASKEDGLTIVSGHRRIAALALLGSDAVSVRYLPADLPEPTLISIAITENTYQRRLNVVEESRCYRLLSRHFPSFDNEQQLLRHLGLSNNKTYIKKTLPVSEMPESIQTHIISGTLSLPIALQLGELERGLAVKVADLFTYLKIGLNKQRELLRLVKEISKRDGRSFEAVLWDRNITDILEDKNKDLGLKVREIRMHLRQCRYPSITTFKKQFTRLRDDLTLPPKVDLLPPHDFEGADYELKLKFDDQKRLKKQLEQLLELVDYPELRKILKSVSTS